MILEKLLSWTSRLFFLSAFVLLGFALLEKVANLAGYTISQLHQSWRILELSVVLVVFVIAMQLKELREEFKGKKL